MNLLLALAASPRRSGNSEVLLDAFCRGPREKGWQVGLIRLNELHFRPCQACDRCAETGWCVIKDDMQRLYPLVSAARAMVLSTPVYFGSLSGQAKIFIDRFQCWWQAKYHLQNPPVRPEEKRKAYLICAGALKKPEYCANAAEIFKVFLHNLNFHYKGMLCAQGFEARGSVARDTAMLEAAHRAGLKLIGEDSQTG